MTTGGSQQASKVQSAERVNGKTGAAAGSTDAVQISNLSREVEALQADPARGVRLASLQAAVADGTYHPDSQELSKALVDNAFEPRAGG